jgi:protein-L-isoaspartate(D-aspartate) O-methyltransferase
MLLNGASEIAPQRLFDQLADGGRLVCVLGSTPGKAMLFLRTGAEVSGRPLFDANAAILPGFSKKHEFVF